MTLSEARYFELYCDTCQAVLGGPVESASESRVREIAKEEGWESRGDSDYCRDCLEAGTPFEGKP